MGEMLRLDAARNLKFAPVLDNPYTGGELPLAGATITMQVRSYPGAAGAPVLQDTNVEWVDVAIPTDDEPTQRILTVLPVIEKAALQAVPGLGQPEPGDPRRLVHEIKITYFDGDQDVLLAGDFYLWPGVDNT